LSEVEMRGRGCRGFQTASCCRKAKFSMSNSRRERKNRTAGSLSRRNMSRFSHETTIHLSD
jgi:hypothetical protein